MEQSELELLKKVLPDGIELVEHTNEGWSVWDANYEWQLPLDLYASAKHVIHKIMLGREEIALERGRSEVETQVCNALGINARIQMLREELLDKLDAIADKHR